MLLGKEEFNKLEIREQIEYINNLLAEGRSLTNISSDLNISRATIRKRFIKIGYIYNKQINSYIKASNDISNTKVKQGNTDIQETKEKTMYNNSDTDVKHKLIRIAKEYEILIEIIEKYKSTTNIVQSNNNIVIDLPSNKSELTSFRVNSEILKKFNKFAKNNKQYRKIDIVSMALKEYIENHS